MHPMNTKKIAPLAFLMCVIAFVGALVCLEPVVVPSDLDFGPLYRSIQRVYEGQEIYHVSPELVERNSTSVDLRGEFSFPGPPWYVALMLPLGLLSASKAALCWALLNIAFLCGAIALVCRASSPVSLGVLCVLTLVSAPVQGHLVVGQCTMLAGFGFALAIWGVRSERHLATATGLVLSTFRPHLGVPFLMVALVHCARVSWRVFLIHVLWCLGLLIILTSLALSIDPSSILSYLPYVQTLNSLPVNKVCDTCSSIPVLAIRPWQSDLENLWTIRFAVSGVCWVLLGIPLALSAASSEVVLAGAMFLSLVGAPYVRNYDYVLLVPPLILTWQGALRARLGWARDITRGLVVCAALLVGIGPYATDRALQSNYLWLAPCLGYLAILILMGDERDRRRTHSEG